jgi:hypothetical protein
MGAVLNLVLIYLLVSALVRSRNIRSGSTNTSGSSSISNDTSNSNSDSSSTTRAPKQKAIRLPGGSDGWACIAQPNRLTRTSNGEVTVTGTVLGASGGPHTAPDGDLVFSLKLDPQYKNLVNAKNNVSKYNGGIWCEAVCQKSNKSPEPWHKGDCSGCSPKKFFTPKVGQRLRISGTHVLDNREGGHAEIHPITSMEAI